VQLVLITLTALALHEAAHLITARWLGVRVKRVGISWLGPYVVRESGTDLQNLAISLAGPVCNLLLVGVGLVLAPWLGFGGIQFALVNSVLGTYNLLPIPMSDGQRALMLLKKTINPQVSEAA
jgi:Zn-dependent protease